MTSRITLGLEEDLQVVEASSFALAGHRFVDSDNMLAAGQRRRHYGFGSIAGESHPAVLTLKTPACATVDEAIEMLSGLRKAAAQRALAQKQLVFAAGLHPFSAWRNGDFCVDNSADLACSGKRWILEEHQAWSRSLLACGTRVHISVPSASRIHVFNGLRRVLPQLLALSVSSPLNEGEDTSRDSFRQVILGRLPQAGIPEACLVEALYWRQVRKLQDARCLTPDADIGGDIRLTMVNKTIEVRIMDAMPRLSRTWLATTLLQLETLRLVEEYQRGGPPAFEVVARELLIENKRRATRCGLAAQLVDWGLTVEQSVEHQLRLWVLQLEPYAERLGLMARLAAGLEDALEQGTSAGEQRRVLGQRGQPVDVVRHLVEQTHQAWSVS